MRSGSILVVGRDLFIKLIKLPYLGVSKVHSMPLMSKNADNSRFQYVSIFEQYVVRYSSTVHVNG